MTGRSEVDHLDLRRLKPVVSAEPYTEAHSNSRFEQDIFRLQVAVNQPCFFKHRQALEQLLSENLDQLSTQTLELVLLDQLVQIGRKTLENQAEMILVCEGIQHPQYVESIFGIMLPIELGISRLLIHFC